MPFEWLTSKKAVVVAGGQRGRGWVGEVIRHFLNKPLASAGATCLPCAALLCETSWCGLYDLGLVWLV